MTYLPDGFPASGPRRISGASLAQILRRMSLPARAVLGAEILDGEVIVQNLTLKTIAGLVDVSTSSLLAAARATPAQREEIKAERRPLQPQQRQLALPAPAKSLPVIMSKDVNDATVVNIVRVIGVQRTFEAAVVVEAAE
jgi:hypothetical protein